MLLTPMLVTLLAAVGTTFDSVAVSTMESVDVALTKDVGNGFTEGLPAVSRPVCTIPVVFVCTAEVAVCTCDVVNEARTESGTLADAAIGTFASVGVVLAVDAPWPNEAGELGASPCAGWEDDCVLGVLRVWAATVEF